VTTPAPQFDRHVRDWHRAHGRHACDGCGKYRRDVQSCGHDSAGDRDGPDLCFICRKEGERWRCWSSERARYVGGWW
jgi:hypothetical protein